MTFAQELEYKIRATYPAIYVTAREDWRCIQEVERVAKQLKQKSHVWSVTKGWDGSGKQTDPLEAVRFPAGGAAGVWILTNFHFHLDNAEVVQAVKDSIQLNKAQGRVFVFVSNVWKVPAELQDDVTRMEFGLPDRELLLERLEAKAQHVLVGGPTGGCELRLRTGDRELQLLTPLLALTFFGSKRFARRRGLLPFGLRLLIFDVLALPPARHCSPTQVYTRPQCIACEVQPSYSLVPRRSSSALLLSPRRRPRRSRSRPRRRRRSASKRRRSPAFTMP